MIKCECKGCTERTVGCHSTCEKYKRFKEQNDEIREKKIKAKSEEYYHIRQVLKRKRRKQ